MGRCRSPEGRFSQRFVPEDVEKSAGLLHRLTVVSSFVLRFE